MVFACQKDSFLKEFHTRVVSCTPVKTTNGTNEAGKCFEVIFKDTVLFPEGGGQPCDLGTINDIPVLQIVRRGDQAVHYVPEPLQPGIEVKQVVDWERRLDHMQQHSGQHLITALADIEFGYATTSWWLGEEMSHIELDTTKITESDITRLENLVNEKIRQGLKVSVAEFDKTELEATGTRTRGLPLDHVGVVRVVTIDGIEANMCCGTHVTSLSQLQAAKLMGVEKGKKGKINLLFLIGNRVLKRLGLMYKRELSFNLLLKCGPNSHEDIIKKLITTNKNTAKNLQNVLKDIASLEIEKLKASASKPKFLVHRRKEAEMDYANFFIQQMGGTSILLFLVIGPDDDAQFILSGSEDIVTKLGPKICEILDGKGNGKGSRYQGKIKNIKGMKKAVEMVEQSVDAQS